MKKSNQPLIYGSHAVAMLFEYEPHLAKKLLLSKGMDAARREPFQQLAQNYGVSIETIDERKLTELCGSSQHQGVACLSGPIPLKDLSYAEHYLQKTKKVPLILVLDNIQDPHNLGACLRTADAADVDFVIITKHNSASLSPVVHKVSCGASIVRPVVQVKNLANAIKKLREYNVWFTGTSMDAQQTLYQVDYSTPTAFVLGNEGSGVRDLTAKLCDQQVTIPMSGHVQSLNVSVATSICLFEAVRQRL